MTPISGFWQADGGGPLIVGHRGVRREGVTENTLAAFTAAVAEGADAIELDVRRCGDGTLVIHHDPVTGAGLVLVEATSEQLAQQGVVTFRDVLAALPHDVGIDVEVKNLPHEPDFDESESIIGAIAEVLAEADGRRHLVLTSFSPFTVAAMAEQLPDVERGLVTLASVGIDTATALASEYGASVICPQLRSSGLDRAGVERAHEAGMRVLVWELGCVDELAALAASGVDAICVDDPAAARNGVARVLA